MRTAVFVFLLLVFACAFGAVAGDGIFDVRKVKWFMTKDEVKRSESTAPVEELPGRVVYYADIFGDKTLLAYQFSDDGKLQEVVYGFPKKDKTARRAFFEMMAGELAKKYQEENTNSQPLALFRDVLRTYANERTHVNLSIQEKQGVIMLLYTEIGTHKARGEQRRQEDNERQKKRSEDFRQF